METYNRKLDDKSPDYADRAWKGRRKCSELVGEWEEFENQNPRELIEISEELNGKIVASVTSTNPLIVRTYMPRRGTKVTVRRCRLGKL